MNCDKKKRMQFGMLRGEVSFTPGESSKWWRLSPMLVCIREIIATLRGSNRARKRKITRLVCFHFWDCGGWCREKWRLSPTVLFRNLYIYLKVMSSLQMKKRRKTPPFQYRRSGLERMGCKSKTRLIGDWNYSSQQLNSYCPGQV